MVEFNPGKCNVSVQLLYVLCTVRHEDIRIKTNAMAAGEHYQK